MVFVEKMLEDKVVEMCEGCGNGKKGVEMGLSTRSN